MRASMLRTRLREAVATTDLPQLERGQDDDEEREEDARPKSKGKKRRKTSESVALRVHIREAALTKTGAAYEATVIREGAGNPDDKNYYTKQALREAVQNGLFEGLQAYANHQTPSEEREQPERDVRKLVGHFREARFIDGNPAEVRAKFVPISGPGYEWVTSLIESALKAPAGRPLIGISIDGYGHAPDTQQIGGRTYNLVREIALLGSADLVTRTATGGMFHRRLQEAWRLTREHMRLSERDFSSARRKKDAKTGDALPDGSFPIENKSDLSNAIHAYGRASDKARAKAHIIKRARALGATDMLPEGWVTRESTPAVQAGGTLKEGKMKPAKLQETVKSAVTKLEEAAGLDENDGERADTLVSEAIASLRECANAEVKAKVQIREVEVPVAASEDEKDQIAARLAEAETKLREAEAERDRERQRRKDAESESATLRSSITANKVLRESGLPERTRESLFEDLIALGDEAAMVRLVERRKAERDELLTELREAGIEGAPARIPAMSGAPATGGLLERMGIDRDELAA